MENSKKRSLQKEIERDVQQIEKEIASRPELDKIRVTKEMDEVLMSKIREYEKAKADAEETVIEAAISRDKTEQSEEKKLIPDDGKVTVLRKKRKRIRWIAALAAVLVLALGLGMTSVGSKSYWKELLDVLMGKESAKVIDAEDMDKKDTEDIDEIFVYREIGAKLGQAPVRMRYKPKDMIIVDYDIDENLQLARIFFNYNDNRIRYSIYASQEDSSWAEKEEDIIAEEYTKKINGVEIEVDKIKKPNQEEQTKAARFEYKGMHYEIKGNIEDSEFEKILENLFFL